MICVCASCLVSKVVLWAGGGTCVGGRSQLLDILACVGGGGVAPVGRPALVTRQYQSQVVIGTLFHVAHAAPALHMRLGYVVARPQ